MNNKPSVCLVSFDFPPLEGGISRLCAAIVDELVQRGIPVSVISREVKTSESAFESPKATEFRVAAQRGKAEWELFNRLRRFHRDDIVLTGVWYLEALMAKLAGCRRVAVLAHGNEIMKGAPSVKNRILNSLRETILCSADLVVANSHYTADLVNAQVDAAVEVATLGVDHQRFVPLTALQKISARQHFGLPENRFLILTTSRVEAYKGHDVVLKAIANLPQAIKSTVHYCIAGRGEHLAELKVQASALAIQSQVTFLGFVEESDLATLYGCADSFIMCTREQKAAKQVEGFGLAFLEAQACGTVTIGTRQGGIVDAIEDNNGGFLIDRDDDASLTRQIEELVKSPSLCKEQGVMARQRIEKEATWQHYGQRVATLLNQYFGDKDESS